MVVKAIIRNRYQYDPDEVSLETGIDFAGDESQTQQQFLADADINVIVKRWGITGVLPVTGRVPMVSDFEDITDYRSALDAVMAADEVFKQLPADFRGSLGNDPAAFVDFAINPDNVEKLRELGLVDKVEEPVIPPPLKVEVVNPAPVKPGAT